MTAILSERLQRIKPSPSMEARAIVERLRAQGVTICDFTFGEPDLPTPDHIIEAAKAALDAQETKYTSPLGTVKLRQAIATKLARDNGLTYDISEIIVGTGGKHIIYNAFIATLNPGDEVILPTPYWLSYPDMVELADAKSVFVSVSEEDGFKITPAQLEAAITPKTKWFVINTPSNPSGAIYSRSEIAALLDVVRRHPQVLVLSDEVYEHYIFDGAEHVSPAAVAPDLKDRILIVNGASKGYCMTGWRIGFGAGSKELVSAIGKLITQSTTCSSSVSQAAAIAAFAGPQETVKSYSGIFQARRDLMLGILAGAKGVRCFTPQGAFFVFASVADLIGKQTPAGKILKTDLDVVNYFLEEVGVAVVHGGAYGQSPYIRLSFATSDAEIKDGCERLCVACERLTAAA
jgi:aspartate aminotransferase